jgi:hypothetical protein
LPRPALPSCAVDAPGPPVGALLYLQPQPPFLSVEGNRHSFPRAHNRRTWERSFPRARPSKGSRNPSTAFPPCCFPAPVTLF